MIPTLTELLLCAQTLLLLVLVLRPVLRAPKRRPAAPKKNDPVLLEIDAVVKAVAAAHPRNRGRVVFVQRCLQAAHRQGIDLSKYETAVRSRADVHSL